MKIRYFFSIIITLYFLFSCPFCLAGKLEERVENSIEVINEVMAIPEKGIPTDLLRCCRAIAIFPNVLKGGFIFGATGGKGIICSHDPETGNWSPPAFFTIGGGSWGLQAGVQSIDLILVITSKRGLDGLLTSKVKLGGDIGIAAGPVGRRAEAGMDLLLKAEILSYSRSKGLFAGLSLEGATIFSNSDSNRAFYGKELTARDILIDKKVKPNHLSQKLIRTLTKYSRK
ncbi:MAG: lipid-binding SYLF domain-containing protein [Desulfobacterota bacterium]|nr:lipid-binding SYLF domain-containing protein [Thermodesulfobacteriota bacterium]